MSYCPLRSMGDFSLTSVPISLSSLFGFFFFFLQFWRAVVVGWVNVSFTRNCCVENHYLIIMTHAPHNTNSKNDEQIEQHKNKE